MAVGTLGPVAVQQFFDTNGDPLSGALLYSYAAGTTTPLSLYSDQALTTPLSNPAVADGAGRLTFWMTSSTYKLVLKTSAGVTVWTVDGVAAVPTTTGDLDIEGIAGEALAAGAVVILADGSGGTTAGRWYNADADVAAKSSSAVGVGMAPAAIASGASGSIRLNGRVTGLTGLVAGSSYYISATGGALTTTAPSNARLVGVAESTTVLILTPSQTPQRTVLTTTATGTQHDFAPGIIGDTTILCSNATLLTITGFPAGINGQRLTLVSIGAGRVEFSHQTGSAAAAQLTNLFTIGPTPLAPGAGLAEYIYDSVATKWRLVRHEQGAPLVPTFASGDYTAQSGNWTLVSGDAQSKFFIQGKTILWLLWLQTTTVSATPSYLRMAIPYRATSDAAMLLHVSDNGTLRTGLGMVTATVMYIEFTLQSAANFAAATDTTLIQGQFRFEIT